MEKHRPSHAIRVICLKSWIYRFTSVLKIPQWFLHHIEETHCIHHIAWCIFDDPFLSFGCPCPNIYTPYFTDTTLHGACWMYQVLPKISCLCICCSLCLLCHILTIFHHQPSESLFNPQNSAYITSFMYLFPNLPID